MRITHDPPRKGDSGSSRASVRCGNRTGGEVMEAFPMKQGEIAGPFVKNPNFGK